jgi:hypothetical protein
MTISTIRRYDAEDAAKVNAAALRFCARHNIVANYEGESAEKSIESEIDLRRQMNGDGSEPKLAAQWQRVFCRALGLPYDRRLTVGYGYIGRVVA